MQAHRQHHRIAQDDRHGLVTVELALTLPLYFLLLFAAIEFARVNMVLHTIENAAYEGTRRAILPGATAAQAEATAQEVLDAIGIANPTITVTPSPITGTEVEITVTIGVPLNDNAWISPTFFKDATLTRSCTFSTERIIRVVQ